MNVHSSFIRPILVFLLALGTIWLWNALLFVSAEASLTTQLSSSSLSLPSPFTNNQLPDESVSLGEPCGGGTLLPPWILCLHGTVSLFDEGSQTFVPLDGIPMTVSYGNQSLTGTTFIHPDHSTPTFAIELSPLEPLFLEPVTLTAVISDVQVEQQVIVFPDFESQSQRYDLHISDIGALAPAQLWGHVV